MDDLLSSLNNFDVTPQINSIHKEHPRFSQYKQKRSGSSQEERRKAVLEARKNKRYDLLAHVRNVVGGIDDIEEEVVEEEKEEEDDMEIEQPEKIYRRPRRFEGFLMLSEWLVDVPDNFAESYTALLCPVGNRRLVSTYNGATYSFNRGGFKMGWSFPSLLPGGNRRNRYEGNCILDCIFCPIKRTYYVLDVMVYGNMSFLGCETELRFQFISDKINTEIPEVQEYSRINPITFQPVENWKCDKNTLKEMLEQGANADYETDGVLFYHKFGHYTHGTTPLIGWLKPYMLLEILDVKVPEYFMEGRPQHYEDIKSHIVEYNKEREELLEERKKQRSIKRKKRDEMRKARTSQDGEMEEDLDGQDQYLDDSNEQNLDDSTEQNLDESKDQNLDKSTNGDGSITTDSDMEN